MTEILESSSFTCHKDNSLQCAGHMIIKGEENDFVKLANRLRLDTKISGRELVFKTKEECINHHTN